MIRLDNVGRTVVGRTLFEAVTWTIHPGDRIGLIGANGCGKTTLLRVIAGREEPDAGTVYRPKGTRVAYLPQEVEAELPGEVALIEVTLAAADHVRRLGRELAELADRMARASGGQQEAGGETLERLSAAYGERRAIYEWFGGDELEARARMVLGGLGFADSDFSRPVREFSGGWRMRALMARLLLSGAELLLLDEPTNHLDLDALAWLESHLASTPAALIVVSHDRVFLDRVAERTADLVRSRVRLTSGGYSAWARARASEREQLARRDRQLAREEARLARFVERFGAKASKASQAKDREKSLERVRGERAALVADPAWEWSIRWPEPPAGPDPLVRLEGVAKRFGERRVLEDVELTLRRGDRLAVLGPNGAGKSTLLKLLAGELVPDEGKCEFGRGVLVARYAQHQLDELDPRRRVLDEAGRAAPGHRPEQLRAVLAVVGLTAGHVERTVRTLSGGERARLALAQLLLRPAHLLLLDEPTNHLDLP
ncbi:MAG: ABC-F family ATP-binding cassette domain-containing protein, partial [Acidobacteriota bacterium]